MSRETNIDGRNRLPPLDWIRVFEMAGRYESFVTAAERLHVSPGAVSRTIKELEKYLGVTLFNRLPRGVRLTSQGREFAESVRPALEQIAVAADRYRQGRDITVLRLSVMPAIGERWLAPRLGSFLSEYPEIYVDLKAESEIVDLKRSDFDIAVRYTNPALAGPLAVKLFDDELFPMVSHSLRSRHRIDCYEDIFEIRMLQDKGCLGEWDLWCRAAGIVPKPGWPKTYFSLYSMALSAALAGQGVIMGHRVLVENEMRQGRLVPVFDLSVRAEKAFFVVPNTDRANEKPVQLFLSWLVDQARIDGCG